MASEWADVWKLEDFSNAYMNWMMEEMHAEDYGMLFDVLHDAEFEWDHRKAPRDADRAADGRYLRLRFANESGMDIWEDWLEWPCSFLEFMVALAYSIDDKIMYDPVRPDGPSLWFWDMMRNCGLDRYDDDNMMRGGMLSHMMVSETVTMIMKRRYEYNGNKGPFPLRHPEMDQREVEVWYQANAYYTEKYFDDAFEDVSI